MSNVEKFTQAYTEALAHFVASRPEEYGYGVDQVPIVVAKMVPSYATGRANIGPAMKRAARKLGIKPTLGAVRAFLCGVVQS